MAKMSAAFEKLEDISRGVERLRVAVAEAGEQRHAALCRDLNLASASIDDIPDGTVLHRLVEALEERRTRENSGRRGQTARPGMERRAVRS